MESPASCLAGPPVADIAQREGLLHLVDPFLVEALENPRHRVTVLRMELDIQRFMQNSLQQQFEFQLFPTSYLRRAAHRVAQHYGLQTMALDNALDGLGSRVVARKTPDSRFPAVCLSEIPAKQPGKEMTEHVKIASRPRPSEASPNDAVGLEARKSLVRTVEERKEEYDKARARIFSGSNSPEVEGSYIASSDGSSMFLNRVQQESCGTIEENEKTSTRDGTSRVAIFRDREKDRSDPDYDRSYKRYAGGLTLGHNLGMGECNVLQPPFLQYEAGVSHFSQLQRNPTSMNYNLSNVTMNPYCTFECNHTSKDTVYMQWPSPAMMYATSYVIQAPFYQQPLSFENSQNC